MANYFEAINKGNSESIIHNLVERFPDLATVQINFWEKDGAVKRFYFNAKDGGEEQSFNLNIKDRIIFVNDYDEPFWNQLLGVSSQEEFHKELMKIIDETISFSY